MPDKETSVDLIFLETPKFILHIKGKPVHPRVTRIHQNNLDDGYQSLLQVNDKNCVLYRFQYYDAGTEEYESLLDENN